MTNVQARQYDKEEKELEENPQWTFEQKKAEFDSKREKSVQDASFRYLAAEEAAQQKFLDSARDILIELARQPDATTRLENIRDHAQARELLKDTLDYALIFGYHLLLVEALVHFSTPLTAHRRMTVADAQGYCAVLQIAALVLKKREVQLLADGKSVEDRYSFLPSNISSLTSKQKEEEKIEIAKKAKEEVSSKITRRMKARCREGAIERWAHDYTFRGQLMKKAKNGEMDKIKEQRRILQGSSIEDIKTKLLQKALNFGALYGQAIWNEEVSEEDLTGAAGELIELANSRTPASGSQKRKRNHDDEGPARK